MEQESIVYGCIKDASSLAVKGQLRHRLTNRKAILSLPDETVHRPLLSKNMFSLAAGQPSKNSLHADLIHFGASYQAIEYEWSAWVEAFEQLLKSMYWVSAVVHLETELTGVHSFTWEAQNGHEPGMNPLSVRCQWSHEVYFTEFA